MYGSGTSDSNHTINLLVKQYYHDIDIIMVFIEKLVLTTL